MKRTSVNVVSKWVWAIWPFYFLVFLPLTVQAVENYPYRSDYLWVTVPDHADWLYCVVKKHRWRCSSISMAFRVMAWWSGR